MIFLGINGIILTANVEKDNGGMEDIFPGKRTLEVVEENELLTLAAITSIKNILQK